MAKLSKHPKGYIDKASGIVVRKVECFNGRDRGASMRNWRNFSIHWVLSRNGQRLDSCLSLKRAREMIDRLVENEA